MCVEVLFVMSIYFIKLYILWSLLSNMELSYSMLIPPMLR